MKSVCNTMGIIVPIWNKFLLIHTSTNQITKVDCNAFLSEWESIKLKPFVPFGRDSTLVSWIAIVRNWSKHRFRQRLWPVSWGKIRMIFTNFHEVQLTSCFQPWSHDFTVVSNQQTMLIFPFIHFGKPSQHKGKKTQRIVFTGQKFHPQPVIVQMFISQLWEKPSYLSEFVHFITNTFLFWQFSLV